MKRTVFNGRFRSVSIRLPLLLVSNTFVLILIVISIVFLRFRQRMIADYSVMGEGVTNLMAMEIDPDKTDQYIEENFSSEEYNRILDRFYDLKNNYPDVLYMYVYRIKRDGAVVVFDLNSEDGVMDADQPGDIYELDQAFVDRIDDLVVGNPTDAMAGNTEDGYLLTYCKPIFDSKGNYQCHVCVDFSLEQLHRDDIRFVSGIMIALLISVLVILLADMMIIQKTISGPLIKIKRATDSFSYETEEDHENNIRIMEKLDIRTGDEIEDIYHVFIVFMRNNVMYMKNFIKAQNDIRQKDEELGEISKTAYRDALTGVGNKAAYNETAGRLDNSPEPFAVAVFDINRLKQINDTYGHRAGDSYISGCSSILCQVFGSERIYRIGGDEFAVLLTDGAYNDCDTLFGKAVSLFTESFGSAAGEPWERCSMSGGISRRDSENETVEQVFRRADEMMYANKNDFKNKYGSYR